MKKIYFIPLLFFVFLFQSCFEVVEEVKMNTDGTGSFGFTLNMSQSKTKLNSVMKMDKINGYPVPTKEKIKKDVAVIEKIISSTPGISNVITKIDFVNFIFNLNFDFKKTANLNEVVANLKANNKIDKSTPSDFYSYANNKFTRLNKIAMKSMYEKTGKADKEVFENANYTTIYKFESGIKSSSNTSALISKSKKAIKFNSSILDIINGNKKLENTIILQ
jgi:hypothetical protein